MGFVEKYGLNSKTMFLEILWSILRAFEFQSNSQDMNKTILVFCVDIMRFAMQVNSGLDLWYKVVFTCITYSGLILIKCIICKYVKYEKFLEISKDNNASNKRFQYVLDVL